ncbi:DNA (cytosine-5-)-methyltransferase [Streptomyces sp. NPDC001312]|uniref:DNA (cytosine-5-)-methyltransferase n=1 Tax=Streptomyces sp. NPDC001312 TaxID=3364561 RepID=UPI0036A7F831
MIHSSMSSTGQLKVADLFCGAGGLSEGFREAGFDVVFGLDKDADSMATYGKNHPRARTLQGSIGDYTPSELAEIIGPVDVIIGGPSCQGFSTAGRRSGWVRSQDERNRLWEHMLGLVEESQPSAFLMENVPGLVMWKEGQFGHKILKAFEGLGYKVAMQILLAADYGVPQRRRRLFIVGIKDGKQFEFPEPTHMGGWRRDTLALWEEKRKKAGLLPHISVWDAIGDLSPLTGVTAKRAYSLPSSKASPLARLLRAGVRHTSSHEMRDLDPSHARLLAHVPQGGTWREIPAYLLPDRYRGMRRTDSTNLFGRLDPALPAYTINTQFNNVTTGCYAHPYEDRAISVREGARIQTFPDSYEFVGSLSSQCRQIGNAVPPLLARQLASAIARQIGFSEELTAKDPLPVRPNGRIPAPTSSPVLDREQSGMYVSVRPSTALARELREGGEEVTFHNMLALPGGRAADLFIPSRKVAVFVNECFWHGCPEHARKTKSSTVWWAEKIARNQSNELSARRHLEELEWSVHVVWEHEDPASAARRLRRAFLADSGQRGGKLHCSGELLFN